MSLTHEFFYVLVYLGSKPLRATFELLQKKGEVYTKTF